MNREEFKAFILQTLEPTAEACVNIVSKQGWTHIADTIAEKIFPTHTNADGKAIGPYTAICLYLESIGFLRSSKSMYKPETGCIFTHQYLLTPKPETLSLEAFKSHWKL